MDIAWVEDQQEFEQSPNAKIAVQYAVAYQYEHREEADHHIVLTWLEAVSVLKHCNI